MEGKRWNSYIAMICLQFGYAGMNLITKVSLDRGISHFVLVVYRQAFATLLMAPLALIFERKVRPTITLPIFMHMFVLGLLGPVMEQNLYFAGLKFTSPTFSCAITNLLPALTFFMALVSRMEKLNIRNIRCQAKVVGTILTLTGAIVTILCLRKGYLLFNILFLLGSTLAWASFAILQAITMSKFPAPLSLTAIVCGLGTLQSSAVAFVMDPNPSVWNIGFDIDLFAVAYAGIVTSGIGYYVQGVVVNVAGPLFVTSFTPLSTIIVAILSSYILADKIYPIGIIGATLMIIGICSTLWGKHEEIKKEPDLDHIPEVIKRVTNHTCNLPTIFEDVEAFTYDDTQGTKPDMATLTKIVIVPLGCHTLQPVIIMEAPKLQSS